MFYGMDEKGNVFQTASHRTDGKGYENSATKTGAGDVTLGNVFMEAEAKRQKENKIAGFYNEKEKMAELKRMQAKLLRDIRDARRSEAQLESERDPSHQKNLLHQAALQTVHGADFDMLSYGISGYGKTSDGTYGKTGSQKSHERALLQGMGFGEEPELADGAYISDVSEEEIEQYKLRLEAAQLSRELNERQAIPIEMPEDSVAEPDIQKAGVSDAPINSVQLPASASEQDIVQVTSSQGFDMAKLLTPRNLLIAGAAYYLLLRKK